jgi:hypothetical protein
MRHIRISDIVRYALILLHGYFYKTGEINLNYQNNSVEMIQGIAVSVKSPH